MKNEHLVERFMDENGIQEDEIIKISGDSELQGEYVFKRDKNERLHLFKDGQQCNLSVIAQFLFGYKIEIQKEPFKPEKGEEYYYVAYKNGDVRILKDWYYEKDYISKINFLVGNCFRREVEAQANKEKVLKLLRKDEPLIDLNEV